MSNIFWIVTAILLYIFLGFIDDVWKWRHPDVRTPFRILMAILFIPYFLLYEGMNKLFNLDEKMKAVSEYKLANYCDECKAKFWSGDKKLKHFPSGIDAYSKTHDVFYTVHHICDDCIAVRDQMRVKKDKEHQEKIIIDREERHRKYLEREEYLRQFLPTAPLRKSNTQEGSARKLPLEKAVSELINAGISQSFEFSDTSHYGSGLKEERSGKIFRDEDGEIVIITTKQNRNFDLT